MPAMGSGGKGSSIEAHPKIELHGYPARTEAHFRRFFALLRANLASIDAGDFVYRPGMSCALYDYRDGPCRS
jgi:putative RecB family exonuclease